jgi:transposase
MALRIHLNDDEQAMVQHDRLEHTSLVVRRKMDVLWLLHHRHTREQAAVITGVARGTVQRYVAEYRDGGLEALRRTDRVVPVSQLDAHREVLLASFREEPVRSVAEAAQRIERLTGLHRGPSQVRQFLKRQGLSWQRLAAIPVPPKKVSPSMWLSSSDFTTKN